jgi:hypothetical protein
MNRYGNDFEIIVIALLVVVVVTTFGREVGVIEEIIVINFDVYFVIVVVIVIVVILILAIVPWDRVIWNEFERTPLNVVRPVVPPFIMSVPIPVAKPDAS